MYRRKDSNQVRFKTYFQKFFDERVASNVNAYDVSSEDLFQAHCYRSRLEMILDKCDSLGLDSNSRLLDAGCGASPLASLFGEKRYKIVGMDYSLEMLKANTRTFFKSTQRKNVFFQADIESLPLPRNSFDLIFCLGVLCYLNQDREGLEELYAVLKPGGTLFLSLPNRFHLGTLTDVPEFLRSRVDRILKSNKEERCPDDVPVMRFYTIPKLLRLIKSVGFIVENTIGMRFGPFHILGKNIFPPRTNVSITHMIEKLKEVAFVRTLGQWYILQLRKPR